MKITKELLDMLQADKFFIFASDGDAVYSSYEKSDICSAFNGFEIVQIQADYDFNKVDGFETALNIWVRY